MTDNDELVRLLAEWLHAASGDPDLKWAELPPSTQRLIWFRKARALLAHKPDRLIIATVDGLAKEIPEKIGWLCESDEQWAANARVIGARLVCVHPAYAPTTDPDMPWLSECRCVKCGSKRPAAIEGLNREGSSSGRQGGSGSEGEG